MAKGSLPRYIINFEDLLDIFPPKDGLGGSLKIDKSKQRCKGFYLNAVTDTTYELKWVVQKDIFINGIKIACSRENEWFMDNFDIIITKNKEDSIIFQDVYMKDFIEYKNFVCFRKVDNGSEITIRYRNKSGTEKDVWFDIDYLAE